MPLLPTQLQRCLGGQICCNAALFRSGVRPLCTTVTAASRHFNHRLSATNSDSNGSSSSGQGFGKPSTHQEKKQKPEVSSTTDALLRSLGGNSRMRWSCFITWKQQKHSHMYRAGMLTVLLHAAAITDKLHCRSLQLCGERCRIY